MNSQLLQVLIFCIPFVRCTINPNDIMTLIDQFKMINIIMNDKCFTIDEKTKLIKVVSDHGKMISFSQNSSSPYDSFISCSDNLIDYNIETPTKVPVLIIAQIKNEDDLHSISLSLNKEVYFLDKNTLKIYEAYEVNHMHVSRYLGIIHEVSSNRIFVPTDDFIDSLVDRRGNFNGLHLKGMLEIEPPDTYVPDDYLNNVHYFSENETYDMTKIVSGFAIDVVKDLGRTFNFSMNLFKRKDGIWGMPKTMANGSVQLEGMLHSVDEGSVSFICAFGMNPNRFDFLDFMPPISSLHGALFIRDNEDFEVTDWTVYLTPFSTNLWITTFSSAISFTVITVIIEMWYKVEKIDYVSFKEYLVLYFISEFF